MVSGKGKEGLALLVVVIVVLAALSVAVVIKNDYDSKNNPNGILGTYEIVDYTQYGGEGSSKTWEWYNTGSGAYEGEKIRIDSYDNGTVRATCMLMGESYDIIGYYDPDTKAFGYTSYYDYVPEEGAREKEKVIDWLHGSIVGDTMYLRGYTMSAEQSDVPLIYTFNFTFVKEGKTAQLIDFGQALPKTATMTSTKTWAVVLLDEYDNVYPYGLTVNVDDYYNGVYELTEKTTDSKGTTTENKMTATTIYQDSERTVLRAIGYYGVGDYNVCWYVIEGKYMYCLFNTNYFKSFYKPNVPCCTYYTSDGTDPVFSKAYDLSNKVYKGELIYDSSLFKTDKDTTSVYILTQGENSNIAVASGDYQINVLPGLDFLAFFCNYEENGVSYYGDMIGKIESNGDMDISGFIYGDNGEAIYVHGTLKEVTA